MSVHCGCVLRQYVMGLGRGEAAPGEEVVLGVEATCDFRAEMLVFGEDVRCFTVLRISVGGEELPIVRVVRARADSAVGDWWELAVQFEARPCQRIEVVLRNESGESAKVGGAVIGTVRIEDSKPSSTRRGGTNGEPTNIIKIVGEDARSAVLRQAELVLQNAHLANAERIKGSVFGYDTFANLSGGQVAALLDELRRLRSFLVSGLFRPDVGSPLEKAVRLLEDSSAVLRLRHCSCSSAPHSDVILRRLVELFESSGLDVGPLVASSGRTSECSVHPRVPYVLCNIYCGEEHVGAVSLRVSGSLGDLLDDLKYMGYSVVGDSVQAESGWQTRDSFRLEVTSGGEVVTWRFERIP